MKVVESVNVVIKLGFNFSSFSIAKSTNLIAILQKRLLKREGFRTKKGSEGNMKSNYIHTYVDIG